MAILMDNSFVGIVGLETTKTCQGDLASWGDELEAPVKAVPVESSGHDSNGWNWLNTLR